MKNIPKIFKINFCTYCFILLSFCTGFFKNILLILFIVLFHELGHIFFIRHYEYKIKEVEIYPFGGITKIEKPINTPLKHEILISLGGIIFQVTLYFIFYLLLKQGFIHDNTYQLFLTYNTSILLFNCLPIIPLDGSIFLHSLLELIFPYQKSYNIYMILSIFFFLIFLGATIQNSLNNFMILSFLLFKSIEAIQKRKLYLNKFYLERYLYELPYTKIKSQPYPNLESMQKDTLHFFWTGNKYLHEKEFLKRYFKSDSKVS